MYLNGEYLTVEERVRNGARWLDENFPGWIDRIDLDTLALSSSGNCICGQVFRKEAQSIERIEDGSGYWFAERTLFSEANSWISGSIPKEPDGGYDARRAQAVSEFLGFNTNGYDDDDLFEELQNAWKELIQSRQ